MDTDFEIAMLNKKAFELKKKDEYQEAIKVYDQALKMRPDGEGSLRGKASALKMLGKTQEAIELYDKVLAINPKNISAIYDKANILTDLGRKEEADNYTKMLEKLCPSMSINEKALALYRKGSQIGYAKGEYESGIKYIDRALKIEPNFPDALQLKASLLGKLNKNEERLEAIVKAAALDPDAGRYCAVGHALFALGKYKEAIESYDQSLKFDPIYTESLYYRGVCLKNLDKYEDAIIYFEKALIVDPVNENAALDKGYCLYKLDKYKEAVECFELVLKINPDNEVAQKNVRVIKAKLK
jgi:tetratricopeptide (TPR) repeat protein